MTYYLTKFGLYQINFTFFRAILPPNITFAPSKEGTEILLYDFFDFSAGIAGDSDVRTNAKPPPKEFTTTDGKVSHLLTVLNPSEEL